VLKANIMSALAADTMLLGNCRRVMGKFNAGLREGLFSDSEDDRTIDPSASMTLGPFDWGRALGQRARRNESSNLLAVKQFITATHLLAYEFGQLDQACSNPYDFIVRNVGPGRADEIGEMAFALPVLINYRRSLIKRIVDDPGFSFLQYHSQCSPTAGHLDYLTYGLVALFDPARDSWIRVAANMGLATLSFKDGQSLQSEDFLAPVQAAETVSRKPIAAHVIVHRQLSRIELARSWVGTERPAIKVVDEAGAPATLWDVYRTTPASVIRGKGASFGDLVSSSFAHLVSGYFESIITPEETYFGFLRKHFPAFLRGFDSRYEGAVDPTALASVARGRELSEGLRRYEKGGLYIGAVSEDLTELGRALNELRHALDNPVRFVLDHLEAIEETPIATHLLALFRDYPSLAKEMFSENAELEFFSRTQIQTNSPFDLLRSFLLHLN